MKQHVSMGTYFKIAIRHIGHGDGDKKGRAGEGKFNTVDNIPVLTLKEIGDHFKNSKYCRQQGYGEGNGGKSYFKA